MIVPDEKIIEVMRGVIDNFLKPKFIELGMNASGQWLNSLEARAENGQGQIWGMDYTYYLVKGRAGGKRPPITPLISWVGNKFGIYGNEAKSVAFAVATKIEREGTDYYPQGTDLLEILQSSDVTNYVYNEIGAQLAGQVQATITRQLKEMFA